MSTPKNLDVRRLEILAEPAVWGRRIGAPATDDEVRAMAAELLELRARVGAAKPSTNEPDPGGLY